MALTRGRGADVVCEAVGKPALVAEALTLVRPRGVVQLVGVSPKGSHAAARSVGRALPRGAHPRRVRPRHRVPPRAAPHAGARREALVTARFPLDRIEEAFAHAAAGHGVKTLTPSAA